MPRLRCMTILEIKDHIGLDDGIGRFIGESLFRIKHITEGFKVWQSSNTSRSRPGITIIFTNR